MNGYCPRCKEMRSDEGRNSWGIKITRFGPACKRCESILDVYE
jgi:hypothetical protein